MHGCNQPFSAILMLVCQGKNKSPLLWLGRDSFPAGVFTQKHLVYLSFQCTELPVTEKPCCYCHLLDKISITIRRTEKKIQKTNVLIQYSSRIERVILKRPHIHIFSFIALCDKDLCKMFYLKIETFINTIFFIVKKKTILKIIYNRMIRF